MNLESFCIFKYGIVNIDFLCMKNENVNNDSINVDCLYMKNENVNSDSINGDLASVRQCFSIFIIIKNEKVNRKVPNFQFFYNI